MFALVQQTFLAKKSPGKKSADLHPRQGNLLHRNILQGSTKPLFTTQNRLEYVCLFFQHVSTSIAPTIFMGRQNVRFLFGSSYSCVSVFIFQKSAL
jgi:hypothetical protein